MADCIIAGGIESMSSIPINMERMKEIIDPWIYENAPAQYSTMGITAENVAKRYGITREEMDAFAVESHRRAAAAQANPCMKELGMDPEKVNPNGGAIALGHPLGATGSCEHEKANEFYQNL